MKAMPEESHGEDLRETPPGEAGPKNITFPQIGFVSFGQASGVPMPTEEAGSM